MRKPLVRRLLYLALLLYARSPLCAQGAQNDLLEHAIDDAGHGRYSSSKAKIEAVIAINPNQPEPWYQLGLLYGQMADYRSAETAFRHVLVLDPKSAKAHCRLGQTLVAEPDVKEDWAGAVAEFRAALALDPDYPEANSLLGLGMMHLGDRAAAIAILRHAIQMHPTQASAHLNLALTLEVQPDGQDEAVTEYRAALAAKPDAPETEASLGQLLLSLGRLQEAEQEFRVALRLNPDLQDANYGLARVLKADKKAGEAAAEFDLAVEQQQLKPDGIHAIRLSNGALQLAANGNLPGAIVNLQNAILLKPDYGIAKYNLGLILADSGDFAAAKEQLINAASLLPWQAKIWFDLGRVLVKLGDTRSGIESVSWAVQLSSANPAFVEELNQLRAADPQAPRALSGPPRFGAMSDTFAARFAFAKELKGRGDLLGAIGELLRSLQLKPNALDARIELAEAYASQSRWNRVVEEYRKVLLVAGEENVSGHLGLGNALLKTGRATEAAWQFNEALKLKPDLAAAREGLEQAHRSLSRP